MSAPKPTGQRTISATAILAVCAAAVTAGQGAAVLVTGEELCVGGGCAVVAALTRIDPALFNFFGSAVFLSIAVLARAARSAHPTPWKALLHSVLAAGMAAEGVLVSYQWHVAGAWCTYCLLVLAMMAGLNLLQGWRPVLFGTAAFAGAAMIFSLLSFVPATGDLDRGTYGVHPGTEDPGLYLLFSENCPHCREVEEAMEGMDRCAIRFNPIARVHGNVPAVSEPRGEYDPRVNLAVARLLGLNQIPILISREPGELRVLSGSSAILQYLATRCADAPTQAAPPEDPFAIPSGGLLAPADDGCGLQPDCPE